MADVQQREESFFICVLEILGHAAREHEVLIARAVFGAALFGLVCLARIIGFVRVQIALIIMVCGIVASGFLYAFAGYGLAAEGPSARVSIVIALYSSVATGVLAAAAWRAIGSYRLPALAFFLSAATALIALGVTARSRVGEWADAWTYELTRLSRLPAVVASADRDRRTFVVIEDQAPSFVEPATAPWEITGAIAWASYTTTNSRLAMVSIWQQRPFVFHWFATPHNWFNSWNGHRFEQGPCASNIATYGSPTEELWLWKTSTTVLTKVEAPWELGCR